MKYRYTKFTGEDLDDVGVVEPRDGLRLQAEPRLVHRGGHRAADHHLDGDDAVQPLVAGLVDDAHAAAAEFAEDLVAGDADVDGEVGRRTPRAAERLRRLRRTIGAALADEGFGFHQRADALLEEEGVALGALDQQSFERLVWRQLQALHDLDRQDHGWDPTASPDTADPHFAFSVGGRAYFVVGLHAASSRWTRRFAWPTLVFNPHRQFDRLREQGKFERLRDQIRDRDRALQRTLNPMLSNFGEHSEARQYSGRRVEDDWRCPFHARDVSESD